MDVTLTKRDNVWTTEFLGKERHVLIESDLVSWRSLGILSDSAIEFELDLDGTIIKITKVASGEELETLVIPKRHTVAGMVRPTKPYKGASGG